MAAKVRYGSSGCTLGAEVGYIGVVGNDPFGHEFVNLMKQEGVHTEGILITDEKTDRGSVLL